MTDTSTVVTVANIPVVAQTVNLSVIWHSDAVVVDATPISEQNVRLVSMLGRVTWKKIRHWRGLRKNADVTPNIK